MTRPSSRLRPVLDWLPFALDDTAAANDAFQRWADGQDPDAERLVDMWTYCYVYRYFLSKAAQDDLGSPADADHLIAQTYRKVEERRDEVRNPDRYANWVSVICKNAFLNHVRRDREAQSVDADRGPTLAANAPSPVADKGFVEEALVDAIDELPEYLQTPARLYFLERQTFEEISDAIDKPVPTVRTYKHKAAKRLRKDDRLREYIDRPTL